MKRDGKWSTEQLGGEKLYDTTNCCNQRVGVYKEYSLVFPV
jgi:hypothetical protein